MEDKQCLIIITTGKSGSYLLLSLLDWHPEILVFPFEENLVDQWLAIQLGRDAIDKHINTQNLSISKLKFKDVFECYVKQRFHVFDMSDERTKVRQAQGSDYSNVDYSAFISRLASVNKSEISITEWLSNMFEAYGSSVEKYRGINPKYFAFKTITPNSFNRYVYLFPKAKFIHLIRHPYDTFNAFKRNEILNKNLNYFRGDYDLLEYMMEKNFAPLFDNIDIALSSKEQHYVIKYEDMVSNPKREMMKLCDWLNISWNESMLVPTLAGKSYKGFTDNRDISHDGVINTQRINVFNETLGNTEIRLIDYLFYGAMGRLGYNTKYGKCRGNLWWLILGQMFPFKLELKNWRWYSIIGVLSRRLYVLRKVIKLGLPPRCGK